MGIALLLSWPAAAQTTFCDEIFEAAWTVKVFSNGPGLVIGAPASPGGSATHDCPIVGETALQLGAYRDVFEQVPAWSNLGDGVVWGVHIFTGNTYYPVTSGAIGTINISIDYECPDSAGACLNNDGQGFGPALQQGADYFVANTAGTTTGITGTPPGWSPHRTGPPLAALSFNKITAGGGKVVIDSTSHPDFSSAGGAIQCGFYTWNATEGGSFNNHAGYDNWQCVFTPPGVLKVCKAAGPGVALDTKFTFKYSSTAGSGKLTVPAGPAPGGYCVLGPPLPDGTIVTVTETNSSGIGIPVAGIVINGYPGGPPYQNAVYVDISKGVAEFPISGVTEVTYTDTAPFGFLEICKQQYTPPPGTPFVPVTGNFTFTVTGISGPIVVPAGACSPAIQVPVGNLTIQENAQAGSTLVACTANPPSQQVGSCNLATGSLTVNVAQGAISTQTIATFTNQGILINPGGR